MAYDVKAMEEYIRQAALKRGLDPDTMVRGARSEGLRRNTWQSEVMHNGVREPSYGPFQMLVGGPGTGFPTGLGNAFMKETGLDPRDPANAYKTVDYSLDTIAKEGWRQWNGPKTVGIGRWDGVKGSAPGLSLNSNPVTMPMGVPGSPNPVSMPISPNMPAAAASAPATAEAAAPQSMWQKLGANIKEFGNDGTKMKDATSLISKGLNAGAERRAEAHATPLGGSLAGAEAADAGRMQAAQSLMAQILAAKKQRQVPGLSLA